MATPLSMLSLLPLATSCQPTRIYKRRGSPRWSSLSLSLSLSLSGPPNASLPLFLTSLIPHAPAQEDGDLTNAARLLNKALAVDPANVEVI